MFGKKEHLVRTYKGSPAKARNLYLKDAKKLAAKGYVAQSEDWEQGRWGAGNFIVALLLCLLLIGLLIFIYMLIVKPPGTLTVTYMLEDAANDAAGEKTCPDCAEKVKAEARICRFCSYEFGTTQVA